ncbi:MAG: 2-amino-4-hydroxy-6-hydroxymethyldihydropteridine diphosphokinase [Phycisphaeraceae bacterium]|nr:2-amino-4-hydroxy-6-hydroxymethyldihydropteridine diphosphokinase [Phycisphaerales bacterium]MCB9861579.1 2-amino-4-hydroxy-6-hydroxymethyldihydropteridine diphosphokinase [Phycisphaeraceae bacterium]
MTESPPVDAYIALGSNVSWHDRSCEQVVCDALLRLDQHESIDVVSRSRLYRTPAVTESGISNEHPYVNAAAHLRVSCAARGLLDTLLEVEREFGRDREREQRWGDRTLDLDLLIYGDSSIDEPGLTVPHPRLAERAFVLEPLIEIASEQQMLPDGKTVSEGLAARVRMELHQDMTI